MENHLFFVVESVKPSRYLIKPFFSGPYNQSDVDSVVRSILDGTRGDMITKLTKGWVTNFLDYHYSHIHRKTEFLNHIQSLILGEEFKIHISQIVLVWCQEWIDTHDLGKSDLDYVDDPPFKELFRDPMFGEEVIDLLKQKEYLDESGKWDDSKKSDLSGLLHSLQENQKFKGYKKALISRVLRKTFNIPASKDIKSHREQPNDHYVNQFKFLYN